MARLIRILSAAVCVLLFFGCSSEEENLVPGAPAPAVEQSEAETQSPYDEPEDGHMQLIPDPSLTEGMNLITQKDHSNGDSFSVFAVHDFRTEGTGTLSPLWRLCQWDSGPDLSEMLVDAPAEEITDGRYRSFRYDPKTGVMAFSLDTSLFYEGRPAREGDFWPHLLIEAPTFGVENLPEDQAAYYRCDADQLLLSFDIRLTDYEAAPIPGDWVQAAQFLMYFYVKGTETNDFCWFGLQLFDSRRARSDHYIGYDGGKADASGAMIFSVGSKYVYNGSSLWKDGAPSPEGVWHHVEIDLVPYLKNMLKRGRSEQYFKAESLADLFIGGMNVGWETIGTFRHEMELRNLELVSVR